MARKKEDELAKGFALPKAPKRSAVPETEALKFERARSPVAAPPTAASRLRRPERGERLSAYVPPELAEALRVRCARERRSVSDAVTAALSAWLSGAVEPQG
jgi:hypothetical protein